MSSACLKALALSAALLLPAGNSDAGELRVCADPNNMPFSNERAEGFENRIVAIVARELGAELSYTWWAQRRGFITDALNAGLCDVVPGISGTADMLLTYPPFYRSTYVFVTRADEPVPASLDDRLLERLTVGVQLVGDSGAGTPPAEALARRGIVENVRGYSLLGDYREPSPPSRIIEAVASGEIDIAVAWGPMGAYFARRQSVALRITRLPQQLDEPGLPMAFDVAMGVRRDLGGLRMEIEAALEARRSEVDAVLEEFAVPRLDGGGD